MWGPLGVAFYALLVARTEAYGGSKTVSNGKGEATVMRVAVVASVGLVLLLVIGCWFYRGGCCLVKRPKFQVGDWVSVVRDGNRLGRQTLGQVTKVESKTFSNNPEDSTRKFFYSIKFPSSSPAADQRQEWLTPAAAPTDEVQPASA